MAQAGLLAGAESTSAAWPGSALQLLTAAPVQQLSPAGVKLAAPVGGAWQLCAGLQGMVERHAEAQMLPEQQLLGGRKLPGQSCG